MADTQSLPGRADATAYSPQYSLAEILAIWASVTAPMAVLAFSVAPASIPHTSLHPGLVHWSLMVVGMVWQFVWWAVPAIGANVLGGLLATRIDTAWTDWFPALHEPARTRIDLLADPQFQGQWWILGLALLSLLFNYLLGEELLVHRIWFWPSMITSSFGISWAASRYRSLWMGVIVHGVEGFLIVLVLAVLLGWYP